MVLKVRDWLLLTCLCTVSWALGGDSVVVFNEVMYHPRDGDAVEWVELYNQMAVDVELSGWSIEGVDYTFPSNTILGGGKFLVVASDPSALMARSGITNVFGPFSGKLANEGERLRLRNHNDRVMDSMSFQTEAPWPVAPDGSGFTLAKRIPTLASAEGQNWSVSEQAGGTPGGPNFPSGPFLPPVRLNEISSSTNQDFWIELVNEGSSPIDMGGYEVAFTRSSGVFKLPESTLLEPAGYYLFHPGYKPASGEKLFLYNLARSNLLDAVEVRSRSIARAADKPVEWLFPSAETPGAANVFAAQTNVVINEIMYARLTGQTNSDWVELFNKGAEPVDLTSWNLSPIEYSFPKGTILNGGEFLVVAHDPGSVRSAHPEIQVLGPYSKPLSRSSDLLILKDQNGNVANEVRYFDGEPWPPFADLEGTSLELRDFRADNGRPEAWRASTQPGEWQSYSYTAIASPDNGPTRWNEFVFGLLDAGEVLLDDFSVIENPGGAGREILQEGGFEKGGSTWRFLGTHRNSMVVLDPESKTNHVLWLKTDGPTEHMHNHVETTLVDNLAVKNGVSYRISWRAKWLSGCNKLNTRLYFNRVARTTLLTRPFLVATPGARNATAEENIGPTFHGLGHSPIVPKPAEAVIVSVRASDPDGVKRCRLWSAVSGANWNAIEMTARVDTYSATLAPKAAGTVVQFYIEAEDNRGAISFYPQAGPNSRALYKVNDSQALSARLHNFRLLMLPAEANALHAPTNVMSNGRSGCTVIYDEDEVFYDCGLHLQSSERGRMDASRVGFTVNFPADRLFRGVQNTITFDRSGGWSGRGGRQDEMVIRHIINQAGDSPDMYNDLVRVLTPLTTHSGTAMLLMSKYGNEFIDGSVYPKDGSLFKLELVYYPTTSINNNPQLPKIPQPDDVMGVDIGNLGSSHEAYRWFLLAENKAGADDYDGLIRLAQAFSLSGTALTQKTGELMDLEQWTRVFAFKSLSGDPDTYGFGLTHNQLIYVPPTGKALTFPWDLDYSWARGPTETINVGSRIGQIIHGIPAYQRLYLGNLRDIIEASYNTNYMARWTAHYGSLAGQNYGALLTYIGQRAASARSQLPALSPFAVTSFSGGALVTNAASITLRGTAPYTFKRLQTGQEPPGGGFTWSAVQSWETTIPLNLGSNVVTVVAFDFHNRPVATNQVTIVSTAGDSDGDGLPDDWELQVGLNPRVADADEDPDGDGLNNSAEYRAGTLPRDSSSTLALQLTRINWQQFDLSFIARVGRSYRIQYRTGLDASWVDLLNVPSEAEERRISQRQTITSAPIPVFYRVLLDGISSAR